MITPNEAEQAHYTALTLQEQHVREGPKAGALRRGVGCTDRDTYQQAAAADRVAQDIPGNHSPAFAPVIQPTCDTGTQVLVVAALAADAARARGPVPGHPPASAERHVEWFSLRQRWEAESVKSPVPDYLTEILDACGDDAGALAGYIPELASADPDRLAVCLSTIDGMLYRAGDSGTEFSIQSISKPFVYALALAEHGLDNVLGWIDVEPSGEAFNELSLERDSRRPRNPMINAGALTAHALVGDPGDDVDTRVERVRRLMSDFAGRELHVDRRIYESEMSQAYRNLAIANMLRSYGVIPQDPRDVVRGYTQQCAISVTTSDLATMAATLAAGGVQPTTGKQVVPVKVARQVLSVMMTCGMYDSAGDWMTTVGFPAKSGVSGGILGALPGQLGMAAFSPRLDSHGNSTRGVRICTRMSADMGLHIMQAPEPARSTVRRDRTLRGPDGSLARVCSLQGSMQFSSVERVLRTVTDGIPVAVFVLDLRRVSSVNDVARRMLAEMLRRLQLDGAEVALLDPDHVLHLSEQAVVRLPERWSSLAPLEGYERV